MNSKIIEAKPEEKLNLALSVSKVKTFQDCKAKFRYSYIEHQPKKDWAHTVFGSFVHEILEIFHKDILSGNKNTYDIILTKSFAEAQENWKEKLNKEQIKEAQDICNVYLKQMNKQKLDGKLAEVLDVEKSFYIDIDGKILLSGYIDRIQIDPDGVIHVADYKTTKNKKYLKDFFQLLTYAFVLCLEDPNLQKVRASYICLRHDFYFITKEFGRDEIMTVESKFLEYADKINSEKIYRPTTTRLCGYCDFLELCDLGTAYMDNINGVIKHGEQNW